MPNVWLIVIPVMVALMTIAINAWINMHIKFAPTRDAAVQSLKQVALRVLRWALNLSTACGLIWYLTRPEPVTRWVVFMIAFQMGALLLALLLNVVRRMIDNVVDALDVTARLATSLAATHEIVGQHLDLTKSLMELRRADGDAPKE